MLTIRAEQMRVLQAARLQQFERHAVAHIAATVPAFADASVAQLANIKLGVARGLHHFSTERDVSRYVEIVLRNFGGFTADDHPARALEMIASQSITAERRLGNFERWARRSAHAG